MRMDELWKLSKRNGDPSRLEDEGGPVLFHWVCDAEEHSREEPDRWAEHGPKLLNRLVHAYPTHGFIPRIRLRTIEHAQILLVLPCNAAACVGNYFRAEVYRRSGWNTWREADFLLRDLRKEGRVAFAAVDSSILETAPEDPRGAIVLETEMDRAKSPDGEDWGAPSWRWFRPTRAGRWTALEELTEALIRGVRRVENRHIPRVIALVNPRAYFLALAAAVAECGLLDRWILCRVPAHPRYLLKGVRQIAPIVRAAAEGIHQAGGIYAIPALLPALRDETRRYRDRLPPRWRRGGEVPTGRAAGRAWATLRKTVHSAPR